MAYRIIFSGLMSFIRYRSFEQVDVLILNPCAEDGHSHGSAGKHQDGNAGATEPHSHTGGEATCEDHHFPQLMIKMGDLAEWRLPGVVHGCGWRHFDLAGKTLFTTPGEDRQIDLRQPDDDEYDVDPVGTMRHVSYDAGIIDMAKVFKSKGDKAGHIDHEKVLRLLKSLGKDLIATRICLPKGKLTAFAPLDRSARNAFRWEIGDQTLPVLGEMVMFEPDEGLGNRIDLGNGEYVTLKSKQNVTTVWITAEPLTLTRIKDPHKARHVDHYFKLMPGWTAPGDGRLAGPELKLNAALNFDTPICPQSGGETEPPLPPP